MTKQATDTLFRVGLIGKGVDAVLEVAGGFLLLTPTRLARWVTLLSQHELYRHHQVLAGHLDNLAASVSEKASMVEAAYLMVHGTAKIVLILGIVAGKRWGYSGLIAVLSFFTCVEFGRALTAHELLTGLLGVFDLMVVAIIYKEYKQKFPAAAAKENGSLK
jgi:uncharacterized membrane protein